MAIKTNTRRLEADFENFLESILYNVDESDLTPEKRAKRRAESKGDDLAFAKIYFPDIFDLPWNDLHRHIATLHNGRYTVSGHRESGKTALVFVSKIVKPICFQKGGIINISLRKLDMAERRAEAIKNLMMRNRLLCYDYDLDKRLTKDNVGYYIIGNTTLMATSYKTGLRGHVTETFKRFRISIQDDLYNRTTVNSDLDNARVKDFVQSEVYGQLERGALSITLGNSITENCPIMLMKAEAPENHFSFPAINETGESNWLEYRSTEEWRIFSEDTPLDIWSGDYMDVPYESGEIFTKEDFHSVAMNFVKIVASITAIDPSHGQSPEACFKGIVTVGITDRNFVVVQDIYIRKSPYGQVFDYLSMLRDSIPNFKAILFENDFNQWGYADPYYINWLEKPTSQALPIIRYSSKSLATQDRGADKESRIMNLVFPHQTAKLTYDEAITGKRDYQILVHQALAFGSSKEKLDGLDALATAYLMIRSYVTSGNFKSLKQRSYQKRRFR